MQRQHMRKWGAALASVAVLTAGLWLLRPVLQPENLILCYVPLVLVVALKLGQSAAVVASLASFLAYNFWFVPPLYTFTVERPQDLIRLGIFLGVAILVGAVAAREHAATAAATDRANQMTALYQLGQELSRSLDPIQMLSAVATAAQRMVHAGGVEVHVGAQGGREPATFRGGNCAGPPDLTTPIATERGPIGELQVWQLPAPALDGDETLTLLTAIATQLGLVIERADAVTAAAQTRSLREADRLKSALLSSLSHDLRTPLAAIKGAASNLLDPTVTWDAPTQRAFAETIDLEADRLNRFMRNLLEMSRLESGASRRPLVPIEIGEVVGSTIQRLRPLLKDHRLEVLISPDLAPIPMDAVQIELVLSNLLENAAKYAPAGSPISISAEQNGAELCVAVADRGPGIPPPAIDRLFEKFFRVEAPETGPGGAGLGLAICQGIVVAHGGRIQGANRAGGGAVFTFTLPLQAGPQPRCAEEHTRSR